jgi:hypothetical protein
MFEVRSPDSSGSWSWPWLCGVGAGFQENRQSASIYLEFCMTKGPLLSPARVCARAGVDSERLFLYGDVAGFSEKALDGFKRSAIWKAVPALQ